MNRCKTGWPTAANPDAAFLYAELSAKSDRLEQTRRDMRRLPRDRRERLMVSVDVWQAYEDKAPRAVVDALDHFGPALRILANRQDADDGLRRTVDVALRLQTASPEN